jgi:membrane protease subunit HflK
MSSKINGLFAAKAVELVSSIGRLFKSPWEDDSDKKPEPKKSGGYDYDEIFKKGKLNFQKYLKDRKPNTFGSDFNYLSMAILALVAIVAIWLLSGFYVVNEGEQALVTRFGKYVRTTSTGLNYHIPAPIEKIFIENVDMVRRVEVGFRSGNNGRTPNAAFASQKTKDQKASPDYLNKESLMLTGDENVLDINFVVQWRISNLKDYAFNVASPIETVKNASESAMREVISSTPLSVAQTEGRSKIQQDAKVLLQKILDSYSSGVEITVLQMLKVDPPQAVIDAFRDVQTAKADKEKAINLAYAYKNDILPRARGEAAKIIQDGEAYKKEVVARAEGEVSRFNAIYNQYKNAKDLTRQRIYIETMEQIYRDLNKVILDNKNLGAVPYLSLPELKKEK